MALDATGNSPIARRRHRNSLKAAGVLALALSGWVVLALVLLHAPVSVRMSAVFLFSFFCPGYALMRCSAIRNPMQLTVFSVAVSLSLGTLISEGFALAHRFDDVSILIALAGVTTGTVLWQVIYAEHVVPLGATQSTSDDGNASL